MRVAVIDDSRSSLALIREAIDDGVLEVDCFTDPAKAVRRCRDEQRDLVLVDYEMPRMSGVEFTSELRRLANYSAVPVIMITSSCDRDVRLRAIKAGVTEFLNKPFDAIELQARVRNLLSLRRAQTELAAYADGLVQAVDKATSQIAQREEEIIWRLARAIEHRDGDTGCHVSRVAAISRLLAAGLGLSPERCRMIYLAVPLHDVGKIGISDAILNKKGRLTDAEMAQMREHVAIGVRILEGGSSDLLRVAELIAGGHHEKWDGSGYPHGLSGDAIPIEARIAAIADVFDALCSERPYKPAWPIEEAYREIVKGRGAHFDPACVDVFRRVWPEIAKIMKETPASSPPASGVANAQTRIGSARRSEPASNRAAELVA